MQNCEEKPYRWLILPDAMRPLLSLYLPSDLQSLVLEYHIADAGIMELMAHKEKEGRSEGQPKGFLQSNEKQLATFCRGLLSQRSTENLDSDLFRCLRGVGRDLEQHVDSDYFFNLLLLKATPSLCYMDLLMGEHARNKYIYI